MMVQCTPAEARDADIAQLWIDSLPRNLIPKHRALINRLLERYGPIMHPRTLLCPRCLGVRYGNNPETVRQGWRRRNHLPDTSVKANIDQIEIKLNHFSRSSYETARERIDGVPYGTSDPDQYRAQQQEQKEARKKACRAMQRAERRRKRRSEEERRGRGEEGTGTWGTGAMGGTSH